MTNAINNVLQILEDPKDSEDGNNPSLIVLTSFSSGDDDNEFSLNHREALAKVVTLDEFNFFKENRDKENFQVPHILVRPDKLPANLVQFFKNDLEDFGDNTIVLIRSFADTDDGYIPMPIEYEHAIYNSMTYFNSAVDRVSADE